jgi:hypothetical protein
LAGRIAEVALFELGNAGVHCRATGDAICGLADKFRQISLPILLRKKLSKPFYE